MRTDERLDRAIDRTVQFLRDGYLPADATLDWSAGGSIPKVTSRNGKGAGGYWLGELEADSTLESDYILFLYFLDPEAHREKIRKLATTVRDEQLPDGSWNIYYGGQGEVSASVKAYFALKLAGHSPEEPFMVKAREAILAMGGAEKANTFTKIYLSFLNQFDWGEVPAIPPEIVLLPRFFYFNIYEVSYWSRAILIPLSILYAKKPNRRVDATASIQEVFLCPDERTKNGHGNGDATNGSANGKESGNGATHDSTEPTAGIAAPTNDTDGAGVNNGGVNDGGVNDGGVNDGGANDGGVNDNADSWRLMGLSIPKDPNLLSWRNFFNLMDGVLKLVEKAPIKPLRNLALKKAEEWMVERTAHSDGLGAIFPAMVNSVMALRSLGYDDSHPSISSTLGKLEELEIEVDGALRLQPCLSPVWDTALALNAMLEAGCPKDAPEITGAAEWLVSKEVRKSGDWKLRVRDVDVGGWYFQFNNEFYPDVDDTAAVLLALDRVEAASVDGMEGAIARGLNWMLSMQCSNGGWAAFDVDVDREALTHVPYADHNAMLDPACADITGRVLESIGRYPDMHDEPRVRKAIQNGISFLKEAQEPDGSWYGRWGVNYIYGTWQSLKGLMSVGVDPAAREIRRAVAWLKGHQNDDGGWGETCASYEDTSVKGKGSSTASQTAWAIMGLVCAGELESHEVERGVQYLLETQDADGSWEEPDFTGTGFPAVFYLRYHLYRIYFPLFALAYYRNAKDGVPSPRGPGRIELPTSEKKQPLRLFGKR